MAREMTALAGASEVFWGGVVSYSNEAKGTFLGVPGALIGQYGAVSGPVALAMVQGIARQSGASLSASTTGIAGPEGGSPEKPVGTVWFGLSAVRDGRSGTVAVSHRFEGSRAKIQREASRWARKLARSWWESGMELDSLRSLVDNHGKPFVEASHSLPGYL